MDRLAKGITYTEVCNEKFRSCLLTMYIYVERSEELAPVHALLTELLTATSSAYPSLPEMRARLDALYAADFSAKLRLPGDAAMLTFYTSWLDDRFALHGEEITAPVLELFLGSLLAPNVSGDGFRSPEFDVGRANLLDSIRCAFNDKRSYAIQQAAAIAYDGEAAAIPPDGTAEYASAITPQSALQCWQEILRTAPIDIVCVTPAPKPEIRAALTDAFSSLDRSRAVEELPKPSPSPCKLEPEYVLENLPIAQSKLVMVYKFTRNIRPEVMTMLDDLLSVLPDSLLFKNVREKQRLCYYCTSRTDQYKRTMFIDCGCRREDLMFAIFAIDMQIEALKNGEFTDEMMAASVRQFRRVLAAAQDSPGAICGWLGGAHLWGDTRTPEERLAAHAAVTREDIIAAANAMYRDTIYCLCRGEDDHAARTTY